VTSRGSALLFALAACTPAVNVGSDLAVASNEDCETVTQASVSCPEAPWGAPRSFASVDGFTQQLTGRWAFCGGEKRYTGRGPLKGFPHGLGVDFWSEAGALRYAFLRASNAGYVRSEDPAASGTVRLALDNGRGRAVLVSGDGQEVTWHADFFEGEPVLQNAAFDVWNFVPGGP
jgi:hypothetical protein